MKPVFTLFCALLFSAGLWAQSGPEAAAVRATVDTFFQALRAADTTLLSQLLSPDVRIGTAYEDPNGQKRVTWVQLDAFLERIAPWPDDWEEALWTADVRVDGLLASVWMDYTFLRSAQPSHCGANSFILEKTSDAWRIIHLIDSRRREPCRLSAEADRQSISTLLDRWHRAAADADAAAYFGAMGPEAIFLGTDPAERWTRDAFANWAKDYFNEKKTWDFKPHQRTIYFSDDHSIAWFEESLDTWMGACRGSGVLKKTEEGWQLEHYNLAITVPNEVVRPYLELLEKSRE